MAPFLHPWVRQFAVVITVFPLSFYLFISYFSIIISLVLSCASVSAASYGLPSLAFPDYFAGDSNNCSDKKFSFVGSHVFITGGSDGMGLEVAKLLIKMTGTESAAAVPNHNEPKTVITLFARNVENLQKRKNELEELVKKSNISEKEVLIQIQKGDASKYDSVAEALEKSEKESGRKVEVLLASAGFSDPKYFEDLTPQDFSRHMDVNYMGVVHAAQAFLKSTGSESNSPKKFIAVSSIAAAVPFIGYSAYSPSKVAVRAFCDCLRNEFSDVPNTSIHICFPPDMDTPGFAKENEKKPVETKTVWPEMFNEVFAPETVAMDLITGVSNGDYHVQSPDFFGNLLVSRGWGHYPRNHVFLEVVIAPVFVLLHELMIWMVDRRVVEGMHHDNEKKKK